VIPIIHIHADQSDCQDDNPDVPAQLFVLEGGPELTHHDQVINVEIDAEQDHADAQDNFKIGILVVSDRCVLDAESSGAGCAEGVKERVKERHAAEQEQSGEDRRHRQVDDVQHASRMADLGHDFAEARSWRLRFHEMDCIGSDLWQDRQREDQHAHAANEMGEASPEQDGMRQGFDICENARACCGEAAGCLEKSVNQRRNAATEHKRQRAKKGHQEPG